jgi:hypothetical protein
MALNPPDSIIKVFDPAKQSFDELEEPDTEAVAPAGVALGGGTEGASLEGAEGTGTEDVEGTIAAPVM